MFPENSVLYVYFYENHANAFAYIQTLTPLTYVNRD